MLKQTIQLPVENLRIGAFVARLDRPWIGTPFLFQGFTIETEEQLADLRRLCKTVFVEAPADDTGTIKAAVRRASATQRKPSAPDHLADVSKGLATGRLPVISENVVPLRSELANVKGAYAEAKRSVADVFDRLRHGRAVNVAQMEHVVDWMVDSVFRNHDAVTWLARMKSKDDYLYNHSIAASVWALALGRHLGLDKENLTSLGLGAMLLDIGKTQLPTELLNAPHKPSDQEWQLLRGHVEEGVRLATKTIGVDDRVITMIASHHERFDGSGYPGNLKGDEIQLVGRIAAIVDCYDAMTSRRRYAKIRSTFDAMNELTHLSGSWFQPELVELFVQAIGVFPTGTLVELNTGEVGVVVKQSRFRRLRPELMLILDADKKLRKDFAIIDLYTCEQNDGPGKPGLWITKGLEPDAYGIDPTEYFL